VVGGVAPSDDQVPSWIVSVPWLSAAPAAIDEVTVCPWASCCTLTE